ncbi:hypothetical protein DV515_00009577 [Chloebia gouldiae]|uniref:Uncharacterized protein n=1 Tax=Chloebia gouldiae TaxID=44316 RepID=A0A3L8SCF6_CHLGU|nr:hypothetical protein DV515_00009577 [Chloebia gouldiae]
MQAESGIVPDFEVGEEFHEEPKTYYELKSQPLKSRAPHVQCQVAGAQSCSWYFIGILQLRETVALGTMLQLPPLGRLGFILLNCSPKNTDLDSQGEKMGSDLGSCQMVRSWEHGQGNMWFWGFKLGGRNSAIEVEKDLSGRA